VNINGWWRRRSLRLRVTALATAVLTTGLLGGTVALAWLFVHARVNTIDHTLQAEMTVITQLAASGDLPAPLPAPPAGTTFAQVVDGADTVLAATLSVSRVVPVLPLAQINRLPSRAFTTSASTLGPSPLRVRAQATTLRGVPVTVIVGVPFGDESSMLKALRHLLFVVLPLVILAAAAATWLAVASALRPVDELRAAADEVEVGVGAAPPTLAVPFGGHELRRLGDTLNRMLARLHAAGEQQRTFIADAAHELRSPIASLQTQLEVAIETDAAGTSWPLIATDLLADVQRLSRTADDLLLLARLDANPARGRQDVDVGKLVDPAGPSQVVEGDETALRRLLDNLVSNSRRHAGRVEVVAVEAGADVLVIVDDDGPGIAVHDRERVFDRWVRLDEGRSSDAGGSGLGLPIARAIARAHGGDIVLGESPLGGLRVTVSLPRHAVSPYVP
jgi:signal transduction histidine kinase